MRCRVRRLLPASEPTCKAQRSTNGGLVRGWKWGGDELYDSVPQSSRQYISGIAAAWACVCERSTHIYRPPPHTHTHTHHTTPKGPLWWWWRKDVAVWVIECCWSWPWAHPRALSPSGRPTAERWPEGTRLKAGSRTAAGFASLSLSLSLSLSRTPTLICTD